MKVLKKNSLSSCKKMLKHTTVRNSRPKTNKKRLSIVRFAREKFFKKKQKTVSGFDPPSSGL